MFLIIYWPSRVGINQPDHVNPGKRIKGAVVMMRWMTVRIIAIFVARGNRNSTPIAISYTANIFINKAGAINGSVFARSARTRGPAGLIPSSFNIPNQKNTTNRANLVITQF